MTCKKRFLLMIFAVGLASCGTSFKYEYGDCIKNSDPNASWFEQYAKVEGFGTPNKSTFVDSYALRFPYYSNETIFFEPSYIEANTAKVSASYCMKP